MSFSKGFLRSITAAAWFVLAAIAYSAIDLTPEVNEYTALGIKIQQFTFREDKKRIEYEPPQGWTFSGGESQLRLKPPKKTFAEAVIEAAPLSKPHPLDESVRASLKEKFVATLPAGSQFVKVEQEVESPVLVKGNPTFEIIASYQLIGEKFCASAMFANIQDAQLTFRFSSRKEDFDSLHREFRTSILSWHWVDLVDQSAKTETSTDPAQ